MEIWSRGQEEEDFLECLITFSISFRVIGPSSNGVVGAGGSLLMSMCCALIDLFLVTYCILVQVMKPGIELPTCAQVLA